MLERFNNFISENSLFNKNNNLLVAVSGGMDSVVLCHLLQKGQYKFSIAHCNFNLRGQESDQDEAFVQKLAKKLKVPCFTKSFDAAGFATQNKLSIQMAARELRYSWFQEIARDQSFDFILTAHHQSDLAETILLNLIRGTGIAGLHGIKPLQGIIARPLLFAGREEIMKFVAEEQVTWREDSSNESTKYNRNFVRKEILPLIKQLNPGFEETLKETVEKVLAVENLLSDEVGVLRSNLKREKEFTEISYENLKQDKNLSIKLYEILKDFNFNYSQTKSIVSSIGRESGKQFESSTHTLVNDRNRFIITKKSLEQFSSLEIYNPQEIFTWDNKSIKVKEFPAANFKIKTNKNFACVNAEKIKFPLVLRKWKEGDWFIPLGMNKKKKLSDFFIDEKIPLNLKDKVRVLVSDGSIVYIVGMRVDDRFKITEETTSVYEIEYTE